MRNHKEVQPRIEDAEWSAYRFARSNEYARVYNAYLLDCINNNTTAITDKHRQKDAMFWSSQQEFTMKDIIADNRFLAVKICLAHDVDSSALLSQLEVLCEKPSVDSVIAQKEPSESLAAACVKGDLDEIIKLTSQIGIKKTVNLINSNETDLFKNAINSENEYLVRFLFCFYTGSDAIELLTKNNNDIFKHAMLELDSVAFILASIAASRAPYDKRQENIVSTIIEVVKGDVCVKQNVVDSNITSSNSLTSNKPKSDVKLSEIKSTLFHNDFHNDKDSEINSLTSKYSQIALV